MKQSKKYVILHIETGDYLKTSELKIDVGISIVIPTELLLYVYVNLTDLHKSNIERNDFSLKRDAIYFKDKVSAITFLRDIYLPGINDSWYRKRKFIRRFYRNEFEVVEV